VRQAENFGLQSEEGSPVRRREFISLLGGAAAVVAARTEAPQPAVKK
jgi:hypothetical protein